MKANSRVCVLIEVANYSLARGLRWTETGYTKRLKEVREGLLEWKPDQAGSKTWGPVRISDKGMQLLAQYFSSVNDGKVAE